MFNRIKDSKKMENFNITRFGQALKCHVLVSRKSWIRLYGIFTLVMFMANLFWTRLQGIPYDEMVQCWPSDISMHYDRNIEQSVVFGFIFFCISMLFGASGMFAQMKDTRKRSAYLLWPVTNFEKYVISVLLAIFLVAFITFGAFVTADALRVLVDWATGRIIIWGIPHLSDPFSGMAISPWQLSFVVFTLVLHFHSVYMLGGTLFRRQQFLFTSIVIFVFSISLTLILNQIDWSGVTFEPFKGNFNMETSQMEYVFYPSFYVCLGISWLFIVFHYWASYKLFTRMQVINNKWLNV